MLELTDLIEYRDRPESDFVAAYPHPFILVDTRPLKRLDAPRFATMVADLSSMEGDIAKAVDQLMNRPVVHSKTSHLKLFPIKKRPGNPYSRRIFVGSTGRADISMNFEGISKTHACFLHDSSSDSYAMEDCGSTNGTKLEGRSLDAHARVPLELPATVTFGSINVEILGPGHVYSMLRKLLKS